MASTILGKLYLIPTTGDCDPMDVPQTIKEVSSLIPILLRTTRQLGNQSKLLIQKKKQI
jgi:hypothetical protein